jgi:molybdopterin-guanine dinucleotide biosynthesis protein A
MRGVLTALDASPGPVLITTVDMPGITSDQLRWLLAQINAKPAAPGILCRPNGRVEPFPSVYRKSAADVVRARLESRRFFVHGLLDHVGFAAVVTPTQWPDRTWANLNRPEDVAAFGRM